MKPRTKAILYAAGIGWGIYFVSNHVRFLDEIVFGKNELSNEEAGYWF